MNLVTTKRFEITNRYYLWDSTVDIANVKVPIKMSCNKNNFPNGIEVLPSDKVEVLKELGHNTDAALREEREKFINRVNEALLEEENNRIKKLEEIWDKSWVHTANEFIKSKFPNISVSFMSKDKFIEGKYITSLILSIKYRDHDAEMYTTTNRYHGSEYFCLRSSLYNYRELKYKKLGSALEKFVKKVDDKLSVEANKSAVARHRVSAGHKKAKMLSKAFGYEVEYSEDEKYINTGFHRSRKMIRTLESYFFIKLSSRTLRANDVSTKDSLNISIPGLGELKTSTIKSILDIIEKESK